eukprot:CAMPEP_0117685030 /NCGR_PEP_ID=MMETSP0804-20121206/21496_1 /TAXON_ID=1074897 /ORGANISM="Tetraselmis astigmatica, Strain CCMP880" /LENGTH=57 /DNA_ID=CAMNT_0005496223 /DNA_START=83 /DNA_END=256 /DNA_ORIENTATION=+
MAGVTLYGRALTASVGKEILIGLVFGAGVGFAWKYQHWSERKKIEEYYAKMEKKASA